MTEVSVTDVAVITTELGLGAVVGAVYTPFASIEPTLRYWSGRDQVTFKQLAFTVVLHPGLLTVAMNVKCSPVPTVAAAGLIEMLIPVMIVTLAVAVFVVSAAAVAVIVTVGSGVTVPETVAVGSMAGAV